MTPSATDPVQRARQTAVAAPADRIEFAEYVDEGVAAAPPTSESAVPAPAWFRNKAARPATLSESLPTAAAAEAVPVPAELVTAATAPAPAADDVGVDLGLTNVPVVSRRAGKASRFPIIKPQRRKRPEADDEEFSWTQFLAWLKSSAGNASGASLIAHVVLFVAMSLMVLGGQKPKAEFTTIVAEPEGDYGPVEFTGMLDLSEVASGGSRTLDAALTNLNVDSLRPSISPELMANAAQVATGGGKGGQGDGAGQGDNSGDGFGDGEGFLFKMPKGGKAVAKGSFSAWTVPQDPSPGEDYMIVIRIKLPPETKLYRVSDIAGAVQGSDNYALKIPFDKEHPERNVTERKGKVVPLKLTDYLPIVEQHVQMMVKVPGASQNVRDKIEIRSKLLKENQQLELVF